MDSETNIHELKEKVQKFCEARDWDKFHGPKELAIGAITEASELLEHFRFKTEDQIKELLKDPKKKHEIGEELADTTIFLLRFAQMNDIDISQAIHTKLEKSEDRYPVDKCKGKNLKYNQY
ncbi:nucleotide pyrophosphohydrolase [Nanoarchaeota archaeon]